MSSGYALRAAKSERKKYILIKLYPLSKGLYRKAKKGNFGKENNAKMKNNGEAAVIMMLTHHGQKYNEITM